MIQQSLTNMSGWGIEINYPSLHSALHNFSPAEIIFLCPQAGTTMESAVTDFFKKESETGTWSKVFIKPSAMKLNVCDNFQVPQQACKKKWKENKNHLQN